MPNCNLIHWLCFGSDATVFYNYVDYQFTNHTNDTNQLLFWFDKKCINGDVRINRDLEYKYYVFEKNHHLAKKGDVYYRNNEIWREKYLKKEVEKSLIQNWFQRTILL